MCAGNCNQHPTLGLLKAEMGNIRFVSILKLHGQPRGVPGPVWVESEVDEGPKGLPSRPFQLRIVTFVIQLVLSDPAYDGLLLFLVLARVNLLLLLLLLSGVGLAAGSRSLVNLFGLTLVGLRLALAS